MGLPCCIKQNIVVISHWWLLILYLLYGGICNFQLLEDQTPVTMKCFIKKVLLKVTQNSREIPPARVSFLRKLLVQYLQPYQQKTPAQVFSCEFWNNFKTICFVKLLRTAASQNYFWLSTVGFKTYGHVLRKYFGMYLYRYWHKTYSKCCFPLIMQRYFNC